ncbi:MAG: guanylate kinase [Alphaproteobacteria bacterium]|nr:guanylate kinase [Alphaproteobacteria bacterium]
MSGTIDIPRRGLMLVLSSPSGAGKTTLSRLLLESDQGITMSVSVTTRPKRPAEVDGRDYHFVTREDFERMVAKGEFLEHATVFGNSYGTLGAPVEAALRLGRDVLFDIDWQGTQQLRQKARNDVVAIFVLPPSRAELERRLHARAQDSEEVVRGRMAKANDEMSHWAEYDYIIINEDMDTALKRVVSILGAERQRRDRLTGLSDFVRTLMKG